MEQRFGSGICRGISLMVLLLALIAPGATGSGPWSSYYMGPEAPDSDVIDDDWIVSGTEVRSSEDIVLNGNLSITGKLVLDNAILRMNVTSGGTPAGVTVMTGGTLELRNGSMLIGHNGIRFHFWARTGSNILINRSQVIGCGGPMEEKERSGIYSNTGNFTVLDSNISFGGVGLYGEGAGFTVLRSTIQLMDTHGIVLDAGSSLTGSFMNISNSNQAGISCKNSTISLGFSRFEGNTRSIEISGSYAVLTECGISSRDMFSIVLSSTRANMTDCYALSPGGAQMLVGTSAQGSSQVDLINTTMTNIIVEDTGAVVRERYRTDFKVTTNGGAPANNSDVEVWNSAGRLEFFGLTQPDGSILDVPVEAFIYTTVGKLPMDPHNLSVFYEGAERSRDFNVLSSHMVEIRVLISEPFIELIKPENGTWSSSMTVSVEGRIIDVRPISALSLIIDSGKEQTLPPSSQFSVDLSLQEGWHHLEVTTMNDDGKFGKAFCDFGVDVTVPELGVLSPADGFYTNMSTITIVGICEVGSKLYLNDVLTAHPERTFRTELAIKEGRNEIVVKAVDKALNTAQVDLVVIKDTTPPAVLIFKPANGTKTRSHNVTVEGSTSLDTAKLTVNGALTEIDVGGGFVQFIDTLVEGLNRIEIVAVDRTGSSTTKVLWVIVDTRPPLLVLTDAPSITRFRDVVISGMTEEGATVMVDQIPAQVVEGEFSAEIALYNGENNITVMALDELQNTKVLYLVIILDTEAPSFERISPPSNAIVENPVLEVTGEAFDEHGIDMVRGRHSGGQYQVISEQSEFDWVLTLVPGENELELEAVDLAGNVEHLDLRYILDTSKQEDRTEPMVKIVSPNRNSTMIEGEVVVQGSASDDRELSYVQVRLDGGAFMDVNGTEQWTISIQVPIGNHLIEARATDSTGNIASDVIRISVVRRASGEDDDGSRNDIVPLIAIVVFLLLLAAVILALMIYKRRNLEGTNDGHGKEEDIPVRENGRGQAAGGPIARRRGPGQRDGMERGRGRGRKEREIPPWR